MNVTVSKAGTVALWAIFAVLAANLFIEHLWPWFYFQHHKEQFAKLMVECDSAMHVHADAAARSRLLKDLDDPELVAAEVQLTVCHRYDVLRKQLLINGVKEDSLGLLGLKAMERRGVPLRAMIEPHVMPQNPGAP